MPGCTFRISGPDFDVDGFLSEVSWQITDSYKSGDELKLRKGRFREDSGFWMTVSKSDGLLHEEVDDVERFLVVNRVLIEKLVKKYNAEELELDFGYYCRLFDDQGEELFSQGEHLRPSFLRICGELNIGVSLSLYHAPNEQDET